MSDKAEFEAWAIKEGFAYRDTHGHGVWFYRGGGDGMWEAWQASRDRCIQWIEDRRITFIGEHGSVDHDTGAIEFGRGPHAEAKQDYVAELEEIAAGLRDL